MRVPISEATRPDSLLPYITVEEFHARYHVSVMRALWEYGLPDVVFSFSQPLPYHSAARGFSATVPARAFGGMTMDAERLAIAVPVSQKFEQKQEVTIHAPETTGECDPGLLVARAALDVLRRNQLYCIKLIGTEG